MHAVATEVFAAIRGIPAARHARRNPLRTVAATLITALMLGTVLTATAPAAPTTARATPATAPANADLTAALPASVPEGPATVHVGDTRYVYVVKRGDYLSKIAKAWLGDADRWPEICALNKHRHFPRVGGTLRNCNLIYPGWDLQLPPDARPPAGAQPLTPPTTTTPTQPTPPPSPSPSLGPTPRPTGNPIVPPATRAPTIAPPSAPASTAPSLSTPTIAAPAASQAPTDSAPAVPKSDEQGVSLPGGGWVPWALAAAISATAAMVWLQRRRRFAPDTDTDPPTELPPPVTQLRRAVLGNADLRTPADEAEQAAEVPAVKPLPPSGIGLVGDGAHAAARAALIAVLSTGGPHHPEAREEVVVDAATLTTLIGSDAVALGPWPRLHIADDLDNALAIVEAHLLHRSRILDEHTLTDLDTLRAQAPDEEALPPILLICETPPAGIRMRAKTSLALGGGLHISALLLGQWSHGVTVNVAADGTTRVVAGDPVAPVAPRMAVLGPDPTVQILLTLREAQTGEPPAVSTPTLPLSPVPLFTGQADQAAPDDAARTTPASADTGPTTPQPAGGDTARKARLRVLGAPGIDDVTEPGRPLRAKALELAVFLACHPSGAATRDIGLLEVNRVLR